MIRTKYQSVTKLVRNKTNKTDKAIESTKFIRNRQKIANSNNSKQTNKMHEILD